MNPLLLGSVFDLGRSILDKLFPDPTQRAQAELDLLRLQQEGAFKELDAALQRDLAQTNINAIEAGSSNLAIAGWRPAVGWVCVFGLAYQYLARPLLPWVLNASGHPVPEMPSLDQGLMELVFLLLGMSGLRSFDKLKGTAGPAVSSTTTVQKKVISQ